MGDMIIAIWVGFSMPIIGAILTFIWLKKKGNFIT